MKKKFDKSLLNLRKFLAVQKITVCRYNMWIRYFLQTVDDCEICKEMFSSGSHVIAK